MVPLALAGALLALGSSVLVAGSASAAMPASTPDQTFLRFTASNGLASQYHVFGGGSAQAAAPCAVFQFHGDGAYEFKHPSSPYSLGGPSGIVAKSRERGCLTIPILSPDKSGSITWWENGTANAVFAHDLISKLTADYKLNPARTWLVGYSGGSQFITQFYLPLYSSTIKGGGAVVFGGGGTPYRVTEKPYASALRSAFHLHWYTGANDDGRGGSYNALRDAKAGQAHYKALGFATSHVYPANTKHALDGRFGGIVAQQLALYDTRAPQPPPTGNPAPPSAPWAVEVEASRTRATLSADIPAGTTRTTFRVSSSPFGTQTGYYTYTTRTGAGTRLRSSRLAPGHHYHFQVENGLDRQVVSAGTFTTSP